MVQVRKVAAILFAASVFSPAAQAGVDTSGGGNAVVCFTSSAVRESVREALEKVEQSGINAANPFARADVMNEVLSVESLDLYIHQMPRGRAQRERLGLPNVPEGASADQIIELLLQRLDTKTSLGDEIRSMQSTLPERSWFAAAGVARITDTGLPILMPDACLIAQIAHRRGNQIYFDQYLFERMPEVHKAGLILHELLYRMAKDTGASDAYQVYQAMSLIFLPDAEFQAIKPYVLAHRLTYLFGDPKHQLEVRKTIQYAGVPFPVYYYVSQAGDDRVLHLKNGVAILPLGPFQLTFSASFDWSSVSETGELQGAMIIVGDRDPLGLFMNYIGGQSVSLHSIELQSAERCADGHACAVGRLFSRNGSYRLKRLDLRIEGGPLVSIFKNGILLRTDSIMGGKLTIPLQIKGTWKNVQFQRIMISNDGNRVTSGVLAEDVQTGFRKKIAAGTEIRFDENGDPVLP